MSDAVKSEKASESQPKAAAVESVIVMSDPGPYNQTQNDQVTRKNQIVDGAMFLDKVEQEKIRTTQLAIHDAAVREHAKLTEDTRKAAEDVIKKMNGAPHLKQLKSSLRKAGIPCSSVVHTLDDLDMTEQGNERIVYRVVIWSRDVKVGSGPLHSVRCSRYSRLASLIKRYWEQGAIITKSKAAILEATRNIADYANRVAHMKGMVALSTMSQEDRQLVKQLHESRGSLNVSNLLGSGNKG